MAPKLGNMAYFGFLPRATGVRAGESSHPSKHACGLRNKSRALIKDPGGHVHGGTGPPLEGCFLHGLALLVQAISRGRSLAVSCHRVIHECGSVDHAGLRFAENITLKSLKSVLDR